MKLWWSRKVSLRRCVIPEGHFWMGSEKGFDEQPVHEVYVSAFEMAVAPVTNRDYGTFLRRSKIDPPQWWQDADFNHPDQPVVGVNWYEAQKYCEWLSERRKSKIRLPTEAEWEKAARGGHRGLDYPWGNDPHGSGLAKSEEPLKGPMKVQQGRPNGYGLYDMVFNIFQWCLDGYDPDYYAESPPENPRGSADDEQRVARGASWNGDVLAARCSERTRLAPYFRCNDFGFRWIMTF